MPDRGDGRLLFIGNFDGAVASELRAFCAQIGTTAIWSNTLGFPETFFLIGDGARDEQRFQEFGRRCRIPSLGRFTAYRGLSQRDIDAAEHRFARIEAALAIPAAGSAF